MARITLVRAVYKGSLQGVSGPEARLEWGGGVRGEDIETLSVDNSF